MLNNEVKKFDCYGKGWIFDNHRTDKFIGTIDLSKLAWNKGYTLFYQHFGVLDPLFGNDESDSPWCYDASFTEYVLKTNNLVDAWLNSKPSKNLAESLEVEASVDNLDLLIAAGIDRDAVYYIKETINELLHFGNDYALCGITDEEYFKNILYQLGIEDLELIDIVFLG